MDILNFYYQEGQLESLRSVHAMLMLPENQQIARDAIARESTIRNALLKRHNNKRKASSIQTMAQQVASAQSMAMAKKQIKLAQPMASMAQSMTSGQTMAQLMASQRPIAQPLATLTATQTHPMLSTAQQMASSALPMTSMTFPMAPQQATAQSMPPPQQSSPPTTESPCSAAEQRRRRRKSEIIARLKAMEKKGVSQADIEVLGAPVKRRRLNQNGAHTNQLMPMSNSNFIAPQCSSAATTQQPQSSSRSGGVVAPTMDPMLQLAQRRSAFEYAVWLRYTDKAQNRYLISRHSLSMKLNRLKHINAVSQTNVQSLSLDDLCVRDKFAIGINFATGQEQLLHRETNRVFVAMEDMFDVLQQFHAEMGHAHDRVAFYVKAREKFANVNTELIREYLNGCAECCQLEAIANQNQTRQNGAGACQMSTQSEHLRQYFERFLQQQQNGNTQIRQM